MNRSVTSFDGSVLVDAALEAGTAQAPCLHIAIDLVHIIWPARLAERQSIKFSDDAQRNSDDVAGRSKEHVGVRTPVLKEGPAEDLISFFQEVEDAVVLVSQIPAGNRHHARFRRLDSEPEAR